ncbi:MAG: tRNA (adenosine(37)-N6)-threonylcarbamoyltransferase complex transferase subunit TsaD [Deltaproteobacteria bacterium]|nr:tRNA (adenosine(37)-N6)-threonylcarbamoyltransferase complex transferase subunit TsaD [Deltaproteobacteria bacterium]
MAWVLGIESSCDETAAAVVAEDGRVRSDVVFSQIAVHARYGGVVPELASRAHVSAIVPVVRQALGQAGIGLDALSGIAVTRGPGLVGALLVGVQVAKAMAFARGLPLVGVNHLDGHLLAVGLRRAETDPPPPPYPYVALLASGGHTSVCRVDAANRIRQLGATRDDAAGEAYDKVAKLLGLGYPGGPIVDRLAASGDPRAVKLPRGLRGQSLDFSFSGLKTAVAQHVRSRGRPGTEQGLADLCASFQASVVETLVTKTLRAAIREDVRHVVLCGGVAANRGLRASARAACDEQGLTLVVPPVASCTDNAAMIALAGALALDRGERAGLDLSVDPHLAVGA